MDFAGKKIFSYYQTLEKLKVDITTMHLEGDTFDMFSWINSESTILYWEELVNTFAMLSKRLLYKSTARN